METELMKYVHKADAEHDEASYRFVIVNSD